MRQERIFRKRRPRRSDRPAELPLLPRLAAPPPTNELHDADELLCRIDQILSRADEACE